MAIALRNILLILSILAATLAIPTFEPPAPEFPVAHDLLLVPVGTRKSFFQRLRDSIIEKIWNIPEKPQWHHTRVRTGQAAPANFRSRYGKDVVLRFNVTTEHEARAFSEAAGTLYLDIWDSSADWVDVRIAKDMLQPFLNLLPSSLQHAYTPLMNDLAQSVYDTYPTSPEVSSWRTRPQTSPHDLFFSDYQPMSVLHPWLHLVSSLFPTHVESFSIGQSAEGREIPALRIGVPKDEQVNGDDREPRETILVVGGNHAREWISVSTAAYIAYEFVTRYGRSHAPDLTKMLNNFDLVVIPVLNPDGYEYTWSTDRLWRKNRQPTSLPFCPGIDLDRAFDFGWDGQDEIDSPCTDSFAGEHPFQGVESKLLADWALNEMEHNNVKFISYLDMHSYSQKVLYPYSYSCAVRPPSLEDLEEVAIGIAKSFRLTAGHLYGVDSACEGQFITSTKNGEKFRTLMDNNGGSSLDYFYHELDVKYSYQIKLRDTGTYGFLLPKENIIPTGRESYEAVLGLGRWLLGNRGVESVDEENSDSEQSADARPEETHDDSVWQDSWIEKEFGTKGLDFLKGREQELRTYRELMALRAQNDAQTRQPFEDEEWERVFDEELRRRRR